MFTPDQIQQGIEVARNVIGGATGVFLTTYVVKAIPAIPVEAGQTSRVRAVAGVLSIGATLLTQYADGNLAPQSVQEALLAVLTLAGTFLTAHGMHKASKAMSK